MNRNLVYAKALAYKPFNKPKLVSAFMLVGVILFTQPVSAQSNPCGSNNHRQFDFWLGKWTVSDPQGKVVGHNEIKLLHNGCALYENWKSVTGFTGSSLNTFNVATQQWHQTWVDNSGGLLRLSGHYRQGKMVLSDQDYLDAKAEKPTINRITWQTLNDGKVKQLWEVSEGTNKPWKTVFNGLYSRDKTSTYKAN